MTKRRFIRTLFLRWLAGCHLFYQHIFYQDEPHSRRKTGPACFLVARSVSINVLRGPAQNFTTALHNLKLVGRSWTVRGPIAGCHSYLALGSFNILIRVSRQV